jgi:Na+/H+ antiporter NhaD/arsenite permease-like protein
MPQLLLAAAAGHADHAAHAVPFGTTLVFLFLLVGLILCLALEEKIHAKKSIIAGVFALVALLLGAALGVLPDPDNNFVMMGAHKITLPLYVPGVDWGVIAIILGSSLFVDVTSRSGLFTWIAIRLTKTSRGDPLKLLWYYGVMTVVFSAVLNNVTAMIIVGSLTGVSLKKLERGDKLLGFLLVEGLLTNIGGLLTLISSVPNIIVGQAAEFSFMYFFIGASPYVAVATVITLKMGARIFGIERLAAGEETLRAQTQVDAFDENSGIESGRFFWFATAMLGLFIVTIAATSALPAIRDLGMGYVALAFAAAMLLCYKAEVDKFYKAIDWDLLGFFAALFVTINVMEHAMVLALIGKGLAVIVGLDTSVAQGVGMGSVLVSAAVFSSVTDNIPLAAMLANILKGMSPDPGMWWAVIFGANLGGNLTPIGSASTLVAVTIIHKNGLKLSFTDFVKHALPFALAQIALALVYVLVVFGLLFKG